MARRGLARLAVLLAVAAAVFGLGRGLSLAPDAMDRLRDDAFYEFAWAANLAAGRGPVVSDGVWTSGVQLLWSLCLVPIAWIGGAAALPVVAPWFGLALHAATALLWLAAGRDRIAGLCVALCWLGNPLLVRECQNGQETALAGFLLVLLWRLRAASEGRFFGVGLLACLARTDLFAIVALLSLWRHLRPKPRPPTGSARWRGVGRGLRTPAVVLVLLALIHRALGSSWLPDSAAPMAWLWHANFALTEPGAAQWWGQVWWFLRPALLGGPFALASAMGLGVAVFSLVRPWWPKALRAVPLLVVGLAAILRVGDLLVPAWVAVLLLWWPAARRRPVPRALLALFLGAGAIVVLHWVVRWYPRDYYLAPLVVVGAAAVLRLGHLRVLLVAFAAAQLADFPRVRPEPLRGQQEMQMGGQFLAEVVPPGERIGCFNSGLVTFLADVLQAGTERQRRIVNLDGVVDPRSLRALQERQLSAWLDAQGVRFLIDNPVQFASEPALPHACGHWFGESFTAARDLREVARFDVPGVGNGRVGGDSFRLYWRVGRGEPPARPAPGARDLGPGPRGGRYVLWSALAGQSLEAEAGLGQNLFLPLVGVEVPTTVVVWVAADRVGTGRLFVRGQPGPVLVLPRL